MNVTFLIGNGFDLACGLKSSYPDVYEEYIKQPSQSQVVEKFKEDLVANKTKEKWGNWSDFEMGMAEYAKNFNNEKELIECVSDFKTFLEKHLAQEEKKFLTEYEIIEKHYGQALKRYIQNSVYDFYKGITKKIESEIEDFGDSVMWAYNFINFNYTGVLKKVISDNIFTQSKIFNIHGELVSHDVILGVDNVDQIKSSFNISKKGKRIFLKPYLNGENDPNKVDYIKDIIQTSSCVCLFGISLGDSDLTWKNELIIWLKASTNHHLFIFDYECANKKIIDLGLKLNEEEDRKKEKLNHFGLSNLEEISEQIHLPIGKKIFAIGNLVKAYYKEQEKQNKTA